MELRKKKDRMVQDLVLTELKPETNYDKAGMLVKSILLTLLVHGMIGGFLSAYEIEYNEKVAVLVIFVVSLILSAAYETNKRLVTNMVSIGMFIIYLLLALNRYQYINSGYHVIINAINSNAREYLDIYNGTEYVESIENQYVTVTYFVLTIGIVWAILLNIHLSRKASLVKVVLLTLPVFLIPAYFEEAPENIYSICLLSGYGAVWLVQRGKTRHSLSSQYKYVLPITFLFALLVVGLSAILLPRARYAATVPQSSWKKESEKVVSQVIQFGISSLWGHKESGAGIRGGGLGGVSSVNPDYETDLIVKFAPYSTDPVYLKAYTGVTYTGDEWQALYHTNSRDYTFTKRDNEYLLDAYGNRDKQQLGSMEVENVGAARGYSYYPYYTYADNHEVGYDSVMTYDFFPYDESVKVKSQKVNDIYLEVPDSCYSAVREVCKDAKLKGSPEKIAQQIKEYFAENYAYTLRPGYQFGNPDYISHFLLDSKKGFCAHFASATVMLLRYKGIPARYVEGYAISYADIANRAELLEDEDYDDYFYGESKLGQTGVVRIEVPDANAHSWVEMYVKGKGWIVVDTTPPRSADTDESFWDIFNQGEDDLSDAGVIGEYMEQITGYVISAGMWLLVAAAVAAAGIGIYRWRAYVRLTGKQKVERAYANLVRRGEKNYKDFKGGWSVKMQLKWLKQALKMEEIDEVLIEQLYEVFFGAGADEVVCARLVKRLRKIRRKEKKRAWL